MASSRALEAGSDAACRCSSATTPCMVRRRPARSAASSHAAGSIGRAGRSDAASSSPAMNCAKKSEAMPDCTVPVPMHPSKRARRAALAPMAVTLLLSTANAAPTLRPSQPDGARLERWLDRLLVVGGVLYVAAHPDDENTRLLAWLANDALLRTGYLSLTRGDGGQNLIGAEQGPALGLIRTQELLAARGDRRRRAVLHPRARLRLLEERRGDAAHLGPGRGARRRGPGHPPLPSRRDHHPLPARGRATPTATTRPRRCWRWRRSHAPPIPPFMPEQSIERVGPWQARRIVWNEAASSGKSDDELAALPQAGRRRLQPAARALLRRDGRRQPQHAQEPGLRRGAPRAARRSSTSSCSPASR